MNTTPDLTALQAHLNAIRTRTEAWVAEDPANRWACYPVDEAEFWAKQGITTVEAFEHYMLVSQVFEMTREVWGYKPSWSHLNAASDESLREEVKSLSEHGKRQREAEEAEAKAEAARVADLMTHRSGFAIGELVNL